MAEIVNDKADEQNTKPAETAEPKQFSSFEEYIETVDEPVKELYSTHVAGLKKALESERDNRRKLSEQLKELMPKAEKGSELEKQLAETAKRLSELEQSSKEADRKAQFITQAIKPENGCINVEAAYATAVFNNLFNEDGSPRWNEIKKYAPQLFRSETGSATAAGKVGEPVKDINAAIRKAAGYGG